MVCPKCGTNTIRIFGEEYCHKCNKRVLKKVKEHRSGEAVNIKEHYRAKATVIIFLVTIILVFLFYVSFVIFFNFFV